MPTVSKTLDIKSATLLPETAGLAEISPRKENKREDEEAGVTEIISDYLFSSGDFESGGGISGATTFDFGVALTPNHMEISLGKKYDSFIGSISDEEADEMKKKISSFKKRLDDDLARRNKILFGE